MVCRGPSRLLACPGRSHHHPPRRHDPRTHGRPERFVEQGSQQSHSSSRAVTQRKAPTTASDIVGRGTSFSQGEQALLPREVTAIQLKAAGSKPGLVSKRRMDERFDVEWNGKAETIEAARQASVVAVGGEHNVPEGWVPKPLRNQGKPADSSGYKPDASNSSQAPGPLDGPDHLHGETSIPPEDQTSEADPSAERGEDGTVPDIKAPKLDKSVDTSVPHPSQVAPEPAEKPGEEITELPRVSGTAGPESSGPKLKWKLPKIGPWGGAIAWSKKGAEASASYTAPGPKAEVQFAPLPLKGIVKLEGKFDLSATANGQGLTISFKPSVSVTGAIEVGIPGLGAGLGIKGIVENDFSATYSGGKWDFKVPALTLSVAPVVTSEVGPITFDLELKKYKLLIVTFSPEGVTFEAGPGGAELVNDLKNVGNDGMKRADQQFRDKQNPRSKL